MTKRLAVFASYDRNGIVHDFVVNYLKKLRAVADTVVFVADNTADEKERAKLNGLADIAIFEPHGEYDFGSYKRGINLAREKGLSDGCDELLLCNDSCFAVAGMEQAFADMSKRECDFWGLSENREVERHLQSFFLVFKRKVFCEPSFAVGSVGKLCRTLDASYPEAVRDICAYFGVKSARALHRQVIVLNLRHFFCQRKITKNGKLIVKICKIPVRVKRIKQ